MTNEKTEDEERERAKDGKNNETESLERNVETKNGICGKREKREREKNFRKRDKQTERKSFRKVISELSAGVDEFGEATRNPKFGRTFTSVIKEPRQETEKNKDGKKDYVGKVREETIRNEDRNEKNGGTKKKEIHECNARDERGGKIFSFLTDILAKRGVIKQKESAER